MKRHVIEELLALHTRKVSHTLLGGAVAAVLRRWSGSSQRFALWLRGDTDVWKVGLAGVALLGKQASQEQLKLLAAGWADKPAIVLLDGDAKAAAVALAQQLKPYFPKGVVRVDLPQDVDPGSMTREMIWATIAEQTAQQGVEVSMPSATLATPSPEGAVSIS